MQNTAPSLKTESNPSVPTDLPMAVPLVCPVTHEPLQRVGDAYVSPQGRRYPIRDGIPVLLPEAVISADNLPPSPAAP